MIFPAHCSYPFVQDLILEKLGCSFFATMSRGGQITSAVMVTVAQDGHYLTLARDPSAVLMPCWFHRMPTTLLATYLLTMMRE
jgi:hypothetical protein